MQPTREKEPPWHRQRSALDSVGAQLGARQPQTRGLRRGHVTTEAGPRGQFKQSPRSPLLGFTPAPRLQGLAKQAQPFWIAWAPLAGHQEREEPIPYRVGATAGWKKRTALPSPQSQMCSQPRVLITHPPRDTLGAGPEGSSSPNQGLTDPAPAVGKAPLGP